MACRHRRTGSPPAGRRRGPPGGAAARVETMLPRPDRRAVGAPVQIEFTEVPDADRARRLLYAQIEGQLKRARSRYALTSALLFLVAAFLYESADRPAGLLVGVIVTAVIFAVFAVVIPKMAIPPLLRRFERVNSVPATTVIND